MRPVTPRLSVRERVWLPLEYIRTVGPLRGVTAAGLRAALIGLHAADPAHPGVCRLDRDHARWVPMSADEFVDYCQLAVTSVGPRVTPEDMTRRLQTEPRGHHPVRILVGGGHVALKIAHVYGDAGPVNDLLRELFRAAAEGRPATFATAPPRLALSRALWRQFGRDPRALRAGLRLNRPPAPEILGPDNSRDWRDGLTVEAARSADVLAKMRDWRDMHAPGASTSAITFAAFAAALTSVGLEPDRSGATVVADARRYLPPGTAVHGNFCWSAYVSADDLTDPRALQRAIKAELASGRMLTMMALREARVAVTRPSGWPDPYPNRVGLEPRPRLTFSNQGRHDVLADLPWVGPAAERVNLSVPTLCGPEGITLTTSEMGGALHVEATFHRSTFDAPTVARALRLACHDPATVLAVAR